jgi:hypothetical protein
VQDFDCRPLAEFKREDVLAGQAVEPAGTLDGNAVGIGDALDLRHHACCLNCKNQSPQLAYLPVQAELVRVY